jgi:glucosamine-phosphate N-acetyltransferase
VALDEESDKIIGTVSVLIEHKFNRGWSRVAHLEDVAVHSDAQGKWVGTMLIQTAIAYAQEQTCYKIILDADKDPAHVHYYEKFWFTNEWAYMKISFL